MQPEEIDDMVVETIILRAVKGDREPLITSDWLGKVLNTVSTWAAVRFKAAKFKSDAAEIRQIVWLRVFLKIHTLKNPNAKTLRAWCYRVAQNYCLTQISRQGAENRRDEASTQNNRGTRKRVGGGKSPIPNSVERSPEEIAKENEDNTLWQCREVEVRPRVWGVLNSFPPEERRIGLLSLREGKSARQIVDLTDTPLSSAYKILKKTQKAIVRELGVEQYLEDNRELAVDFDLLIKRCLRAMPDDRLRPGKM